MMKTRSRIGATLLLAWLAASPPARAAVLAEAWFVSQIDGKRVGHLHELRELSVKSGERLVTTSMDTRLALRRMGTEIEVRSQAVYVERETGEPLRFESTNQLAASEYKIRAELKGDHFLVTQESLSGRSETEVPFTKDILFPYAIERRIKKDGLEPGARLELKAFSPDFARPTRLSIHNKGFEETQLEDGSKARLLRFESTQELVPGITLVEWRDAEGEVQKTSLPILSIEIVSYRTERERSLLDPESVELMVRTLVKPSREIPRARDTKRARFRLRVLTGDPSLLELPTDSRQRVLGRGPDGVLIEVRAEDWQRNKQLPRPGPEHLQASSALEIADPLLREQARQAAPGGSPQEQAEAINRWVHGHIVKKSLSIGLATAAEVARNLEGDCTEHAVLAAALARVRGIPSRVAMGLVYLNGVFGYHMWTEVFDGGWRAIDPSFGDRPVDATHIKLATSSLAHGFVDEGILRLVQVIANLEIDVVEFEIDGSTYPGSRDETGTIKKGSYSNPAYRLRLEPPKTWRLVADTQPADRVLVRLAGPFGLRARLSAEAISYDFQFRDWIQSRNPESSILGETYVAVAKKPGRRFLIETGDEREIVYGFTDANTLYALRIGPVGSYQKKQEAAVQKLVASIQIKD